MSSASVDVQHSDVIIVGGGAVGLTLAARLGMLGVRSQVLERRTQPSSHTRAIGVHPVALEILSALGLDEPLCRAGVVVRKIRVFSGRAKSLGALELAECAPPYRFILAVPQHATEGLLERHVAALPTVTIRRGVRVDACRSGARMAEVRCHDAAGREATLRAGFVVGCDGKESTVRRSVGIPFDGGAYADAFVMGDYADNTSLGDEAAVFLHPAGSIESFPLPAGQRRWVVMTERPLPQADRGDIDQRVASRLGHRLADVACTMVSPFRVYHHLARNFASGRVALCGDAAHIVSPSIGQGMNLGIQDAWMLGEAISNVLSGKRLWSAAAQHYFEVRSRAAVHASRRAAFYMALGRRTITPSLRDHVVQLLVTPPLHQLTSRLFTMRGLEQWIV